MEIKPSHHQNIGIVGAGAIAHGLAALLKKDGKTPTIWSPSQRAIEKNIKVKGVYNTQLQLMTANSAKSLVEKNNTIIFALPLNGHQSTMDEIAPYIKSSHTVIISSHGSFSAIYLRKLLLQRQIEIPIIAWDTTAFTAKITTNGLLNINAIRPTINIYTAPEKFSSTALELCTTLFDNHFVVKNSLLEITLNNLNPEIHMGMALCNITRIEHAEEWCQRKNVTPTVGQLIEALDKERIAIATAFGCSVKSVFDHYNMNKNEKLSSIYKTLHSKSPIQGPQTIETRYVLEDVPYGLVVIEKLGRFIGKPAPLHESGVKLFSALYDRDFTHENQLLSTLDFAELTV